MRYSSDYSHPSSSPERDDFSYSPAFNSHATFDDLYSSSSCAQPDAHPDFMSTTLFNFNDPSLGLDFDSQDLDSLPMQAGQPASLQDAILSSAVPQPIWQFQGNNSAFPQNYQQANASNYIPQQQIGQHRRALSNSSSVPSYGPDSPYSRASSVHYPAAYPPGTQYLQPSWDGYSSPTVAVQHLPTPSHTPKSDTAMEAKAPRRNTPLSRADSAHKSLRHSVRKQSSSNDLPLTPRTINGDDFEGQSGAAAAAARNLPKFNRTISDICQDELYNPNGITSTPLASAMHPGMHPQAQQMYSSPQQNHLISQRLSEANMGRVAQHHDSRQPSPFRFGSVYAGQVPYTAQPQPQAAAAMRDHSRAKMEALAMQQHQQQKADAHMQQQAQQQQNQQQPQTVSPKDAFPEQPETSEENLPSLFPTGSSQSDMTGGAMYAPHNANQSQLLGRHSMPNGSAQFGFATPSLPTSGSQEQQSHPNAHAGANAMPDFPAHLVSMETTNSEQSERTESPDARAERPADTSAGSGTYTCTYHGCTERFAVPAQLQRHKRDAHRSTGASSVHSPQAHGIPDAQSMTQAGPHKCTRINPSTGKPCNTIFSRPYDLTRHEDTIHAERKKVRCPHCTDEKTFSRADALTRHLRVVHPHVAFAGKQRRRNAA